MRARVSTGPDVLDLMTEIKMPKASIVPAPNAEHLSQEDDVPYVPPKSRTRAARATKTDGTLGGKAKKANPAETAGDAAGPTKAQPAETKASIVLKKLNSAKGATIAAMIEATGWQAHSMRGFLSAVVKKKLGHNLVSETGKDGARRYRIQAEGKSC